MATIRKRGLKWQVQVRRLGYPPLAKTFLTKEDALRWGRAQDRRVDLGEAVYTPQTPDNLGTISDLIARYQKEVSPQKRSPSDTFHFRQVARHGLGKVAVKNLTPSLIAEFRDHRLKSVSASTVRKELTLLGHVLKIARNEWGVQIVGDPVKDVRKPSAARGRDRRVTPEELASIQKALLQTQNPLVPAVMLFALATGMRRGEALSLEWRHVDLINATAILPLTKNGEKRIVPLSPAALEVLTQQIKTNQCDDASTASPLSGRVFPLSPNALRLAWDRMRKRANVTDLNFHDLRHEAISRFFELGLTVPEVALISGHKDARMLFRYTHLRAEDVALKMSVLDQKKQH